MNTTFKKFAVPGVAGAMLIALFAFNTPGERYFEVAKNLDIFATLYKEVNSYYVDDVSPNKLMKTGIDAMLSSLDPYTNYIPEDEIEDYRTMTTGQYGGIGAVIGRRNERNMVLMPYENMPANKAGLRIGDELLEVDGINVTKKNTSEVSKLLKGQANTPLKLKVKRFGVKDPIVVEVVREKIKIDNVPYYGMVSDDIGYLHLTDFTSDASREVKKAITTLKEQGAKKIILDLRDNPGGLLSEAVNISNLFIPKDKEVVSTRGKMSDWSKSYKALNLPLDTDIPLAVLTSSRSASASEIVAGVVQDYDRGVLIGQRTFGKGLVQATRPLTYNSQLKITTAKYYIPSGRCIQAIDYSIKNEDGSVAKIPDSLQAAFKTSNGRPVYDGGGVLPDIEVERKTLTPISTSLITKGHIFDFATEYASRHATIAPAKQFKITDAEWNEFVKWVSTKDYDYVTKVETELKALEETARKENYYDGIQDQLNSLKQKVTHNKEQDLEVNRKEITDIIESEIVSRYYLNKGIVEASFDNDVDILAAIKVLNDTAEYQKILKGRK
jgi:carboxyl-terminal processing protease